MTGAADPQGRFWVGGMIETMDRETNALYRYDPDGSCRAVVDGLICPNGLAFGPDGTTLYHSDSRRDFIWAWDLDPGSGDIANRRVFAANDPTEGRPDGAAVDAEGHYWICCVGAWRIARYAPDGRIDRVIGVPVQRPTACTFGGPDLDTLYVTTRDLPAHRRGAVEAAARRGGVRVRCRRPRSARAPLRGLRRLASAGPSEARSRTAPATCRPSAPGAARGRPDRANRRYCRTANPGNRAGSSAAASSLPCTLTWICGVRPGYRPGRIVRKRKAPAASAS